MMEKGPNQKSVKVRPIPICNKWEPIIAPSVLLTNFLSENPRSLQTSVPIWIPYIDPSKSASNNPSRLPPVVPSVDIYVNNRSVQTRVPIVIPSRAPSEKYVINLKQERWTTLEQDKSLENIIVSGEIKVDEDDQLQELYIIKLKHGICMLETDVNNNSEEKKDHVYLKT